MFVMLLLSAGLAPSPAPACLRLPHEWTTVDQEPATGTPGYFGLTDALYAWREELLTGSPPVDLSRVCLLRVYQGDVTTASPATPALQRQVIAALEAVFPAASLTVALDHPSPDADPGTIQEAHPGESAHAFLEIYVQRNDQQGLTMLDIIFFNGALVRTVLREETHLTLRLTERDGHLLDVREINVSPTIMVDTMMGPGGCFLT